MDFFANFLDFFKKYFVEVEAVLEKRSQEKDGKFSYSSNF